MVVSLGMMVMVIIVVMLTVIMEVLTMAKVRT